MLDPKKIDLLESLGGLKGLLKGLGMSRTRGLGRKVLMRSNSFKARATLDDRPGPGTAGASQRHGREEEDVSGIVVMGPEENGVGWKPNNEGDEDNPIFPATLDERRKVYGQNVLPHKPSKSLLALMWIALKDKVLVSYPL